MITVFLSVDAHVAKLGNSPVTLHLQSFRQLNSKSHGISHWGPRYLCCFPNVPICKVLCQCIWKEIFINSYITKLQEFDATLPNLFLSWIRIFFLFNTNHIKDADLAKDEFIDLKTKKLLGWLVGGACDSWSWGREFKLHARGRVYFKK